MTLYTYKPKNCVADVCKYFRVGEIVRAIEISFSNWSHSLSVIRSSCGVERTHFVKIALFHLYVYTNGPVSAT